jgi:tryptophanyl-tRNA synthetase
MSTHGPVESRWIEAMNAVMADLDQIFNGKAKAPNKSVGLVLLVFPFQGHEGRSNYISNGADRKDMIRLFRELADRFEGTHPEEKPE